MWSSLGDEQVIGRRRRRGAALVVATAAVLAGGVLAGAQAAAQVNPPSHSATLEPGQSQSITKTLTVPLPPDLDFVLDVDLSGSYDDDLPNIKGKAPQIFDAIAARSSNPQFGLVTFVDFPFSPWGGGPDYGYRRDQDLTSDRATWTGAVDAMDVLGGGDFPESQYESLLQAATGAGRQMPPTTDDDFTDPGEIAPGLGISWRPGSARVLAITTDAAFHVKGDPGSSFPYPGPSRDEAIQALLDQGIHVIAIKAPGSGSEMDDAAAATGGAVVTTDLTSEEIAEAILAGLGQIRFDVRAAAGACAPLNISFDPAAHEQVTAGTELTFTETISVPAGASPGTVTCDVNFLAGESVIATQRLQVRILGERCANRVTGTPGKDNLRGTDGGDFIKGRKGNDKLNGGDGDDCVRGGPGSDKVKGGDGDDDLRGGQRPDKVVGGSGDDLIKVRAGRIDLVRCGSGKDTVRAQRTDIVNKDCEKVRIG